MKLENNLHLLINALFRRTHFFENAGGALTLKSVVETSSKFAAIPDNQGRSNAASKALMDVIQKAKSDAASLFGTQKANFLLVKVGQNYSFGL